MTLIAASCPSNRLAAVTNRTGWTGTCRGGRPGSVVLDVMALLPWCPVRAGRTTWVTEPYGPK